jgi:hypothetical protein
MAALTYTFGVDADTVKEEELPFVQQFDDDQLERAIDRACGDLNPQLRALRIAPESITEANAPDDWLWCRSTVIAGAAGYYMRSVTGSWDAGRDKLDAMRARIDQLIAAPQLLVSYNPNASSTATARSRANHNPGPVTDQQTAHARARMLNPANPNNWRQ